MTVRRSIGSAEGAFQALTEPRCLYKTMRRPQFLPIWNRFWQPRCAGSRCHRDIRARRLQRSRSFGVAAAGNQCDPVGRPGSAGEAAAYGQADLRTAARRAWLRWRISGWRAADSFRISTATSFHPPPSRRCAIRDRFHSRSKPASIVISRIAANDWTARLSSISSAELRDRRIETQSHRASGSSCRSQRSSCRAPAISNGRWSSREHRTRWPAILRRRVGSISRSPVTIAGDGTIARGRVSSRRFTLRRRFSLPDISAEDRIKVRHRPFSVEGMRPVVAWCRR